MKPVTLKYPIASVRAVYQAVTGIEFNQSQTITPEQCEAICEMLKAFGIKEEKIEAEVTLIQGLRRRSYTSLTAFEDRKELPSSEPVGTVARELKMSPINHTFGRRVR